MPQEQAAYSAHVASALSAADYQLRKIHADGDCLFAATILGCEALDTVDLSKEQGQPLTHASHLRVFMAEWIRAHKNLLFQLSGGDDTWRGEMFQPRAPRTAKRRGRALPVRRRTLDDCLDLLADTTERKYDIAWQSTEPDSPAFNLGDCMPLLVAHALRIRIVLVKAVGTPEIACERDPFDQLTVDGAREIVVVQSVRLDHWDAALPRSPAVADRLPPSVAMGLEGAGALAGDSCTTPRRKPTDSDQVHPSTPSSTSGFADGSLTPNSGSSRDGHGSVRRRIFAMPSAEHVQQLEKQLADARAALAQANIDHASNVQNQLAQQATQLQEQAHAHARSVAHIASQIYGLVHRIETIGAVHQQRIRNGETQADDPVLDLLQQISAQQDALDELVGAMGDDHWLQQMRISQPMLAEWREQIAELEEALAAPFLPGATPSDRVTAAQAERVCELLTQWLKQLQAEREPTYIQLLLLVKKLQCVDELLPSHRRYTDPVTARKVTPPSAVCEVDALLSRAMLCPRLLGFVLRFPFRAFKSRADSLRQRCSERYAAAVTRADSLVEQVRLLLAKCEMLAENNALAEINNIAALSWLSDSFPSSAFDTLQRLHAVVDQTLSAGPALTLEKLLLVEMRDAAVREADRLELQLSAEPPAASQDAAARRRAVSAARTVANEHIEREPQSFNAWKNNSRAAFHPDRRVADTGTSFEVKNQQAAEVLEAWQKLQNIYEILKPLRMYQVRAEAAELAAARSNPSPVADDAASADPAADQMD